MRIEKRLLSEDSITTKYLLSAGSSTIECTHVNRPEKHIICFSTAVGCPVGCFFCAATSYRRGLNSNEMSVMCQLVYADAVRDSCKPVLFSAMGEGEPLLTDLSVMTLLDTFCLLARENPLARFAVSTSGIRPKAIRYLADLRQLDIKLQISLHGPSDAVRRLLLQRVAPISEVISAARYYELSGGRVEWNYVLVDGVNDDDEHAFELLAVLPPPAYVKLNRLNPVPRYRHNPSPRGEQIAAILRRGGLSVEFYCTDGRDIAAACGQLRSTAARQASR